MTSTLPESVKADAQRWFAEYWDPDLPLGQWWQLLADSGWAFPSWPEGFGGRGLSSAATKLQYRQGEKPGPLAHPTA